MAKATVHNVDFSNVKDGGVFNTKRIEAGDYLAKIVKVEDSPVKAGERKGTPQYLFTIKLIDIPSAVFPYYCQLTENQLWKLRNLLIAAGKAVPKKRTKVDPNGVVGKLIGVLVEDDEYEGKLRSVIQGVFPSADLGDSVQADSSDDEDEDEDVPLEEEEVHDTSDDDDEADEDEVDEDDEADDSEASRIAGLNRTQLKAEIIKLQSDFQARKSQSDDDLRDVLTNLLSADDEEEDDEPTPPPAKKKAAPAKKAPAARKAKPKAEDIDDEELDELDIDNL